MKLSTIFAIILFLGAAYIGVTQDIDDMTGHVVGLLFEEPTLNAPVKEPVPFEGESITIANWNIQVFGQSKWSKPEVRERIIEIVDDYDIIVIQEIRDNSFRVFAELCAVVETHDCSVSTRAGRSNSKEQYGILFKEGIELLDEIDYNEDAQLQKDLERPPFAAEFSANGYEFTLLTSHLKPDDVPNELGILETIAQNHEGNLVVLGDLNADGSYYDEDDKEHFLEYNWVIDDSIDTTVAKSDNTYDRIILNDDMYEEYVSHGVYDDITKEVSDHYLVWVEIATEELS